MYTKFFSLIMFLILLLVTTKNPSLQYKYTQNKKLSNLFPGYKLTQPYFHITLIKLILNFSSNVLTEDERSLFCTGLRFSMPSKRFIILTFLLCLFRDTVMFEMRTKN